MSEEKKLVVDNRFIRIGPGMFIAKDDFIGSIEEKEEYSLKDEDGNKIGTISSEELKQCMAQKNIKRTLYSRRGTYKVEMIVRGDPDRIKRSKFLCPYHEETYGKIEEIRVIEKNWRMGTQSDSEEVV